MALAPPFHAFQMKATRAGEVSSVDDTVLASVRRRRLRSLAVARCARITDVGLAALAAACPSLAVLSITETQISDVGLTAVAAHCPVLAELEARKLPRLASEAPLLAIARNGALRRLDVSVSRVVTGRLLAELAAHCGHTLTALDVSFCRSVPSAAVGHLLDGCYGLDSLRVFGDTHLTRAALYGHSNARVRIEGEPTFQPDTTAKMAAAVAACCTTNQGASCAARDNDAAAVAVASAEAAGSSGSDSEAMEII